MTQGVRPLPPHSSAGALRVAFLRRTPGTAFAVRGVLLLPTSPLRSECVHRPLEKSSPDLYPLTMRHITREAASLLSLAGVLLVMGCAQTPQRPWQPPPREAGAPRDRRPVDATSAMPAIGERIPAFRVPIVQSPLFVADADLRGAPAVIALWATYCHGSRLAVQDLEALRATYARRGVQFIVLAVNDDPARLQAFVDSAGMGAVIAAADSTDVYGFDRSAPVPASAPTRRVFSLPSALVIDARGRIVARSGGGVARERFRTALDSLLEPGPSGR